MKFTSDVVTGSGRGKDLKCPTINLNIDSVPASLEQGVYAVFARMGEHGVRLPATMHYGARPTFGDTPSCEVHVIGQIVAIPPRTVTVDVAEKLRDICKFDSAEDLQKQLADDVKNARDILCVSC